MSLEAGSAKVRRVLDDTTHSREVLKWQPLKKEPTLKWPITSQYHNTEKDSVGK